MKKPTTYITREEAKRLLEGWGEMDPDTEIGKEGDELMKVRAVANAVVKKLHELDENKPDLRLAPIREGKFKLGKPYPMHGIIVVRDKGTAEDLVNYLNKKFDQQRNKFPRIKGWRAEVTHSGMKKKFDNDHPFFYYKNTGRLSSNASRILVVVDRATEGMNNKYLAVMGVAKKTRSILEIVQRIGRKIRSAHYEEGGVLYAPPIDWDRIHIITHENYENREHIEAALDFMGNMELALQDMVDIAMYSEMGIEVHDNDESYDPTLTFEEMAIILDIVGESIIKGKRLSIKKIQNRIRTKKTAKRELIAKVSRSLHEQNKQQVELVIKDMFRERLPVPLPDVVIDDKVHIDPLSMDEAEKWVEDRDFKSMFDLKSAGSETWLAAVQEVYMKFEGLYYSGEMGTSQSPLTVIEEFTAEIMQVLRLPHARKGIVQRLVMDAALDRLSILGATTNRLEEDLNIPSIVAELREQGWQAHIKRWVLWRLYELKVLPNLKPFFDIVKLSDTFLYCEAI